MTGPSLGDPPDSLAGFPWSRVPARLLRVCRRVQGTWWFSNDGSGRFDLEAREGTCYLATDAYAALREASRGGPVSTAWVGERELREVEAPDPAARLAATTRRGAGRFGITSELVTLVPYGLPRRWAAAFRRAGFAGIRHELRHDPRARPSGVSLFGPAGAPAWPSGASEPLTRGALQAAGVEVLDVPPVRAVTVIA